MVKFTEQRLGAGLRAVFTDDLAALDEPRDREAGVEGVCFLSGMTRFPLSKLMVPHRICLATKQIAIFVREKSNTTIDLSKSKIRQS